MIIYAGVKSERASKGQGGNKFLSVEITGEHGEEILSLLYVSDDKKRMYLSKAGGNEDAVNVLISMLTKPKGKKQKTTKDNRCWAQIGSSDWCYNKIAKGNYCNEHSYLNSQ